MDHRGHGRRGLGWLRLHPKCITKWDGRAKGNYGAGDDRKAHCNRRHRPSPKTSPGHSHHHSRPTPDRNNGAVFRVSPSSLGGISSTRNAQVVGCATTDPATVAAMTTVFNADWTDTAPGGRPRAQRVLSPGAEDALLNLIDSAKSRILIETEDSAVYRLLSPA
jgi:hypothetical protein